MVRLPNPYEFEDDLVDGIAIITARGDFDLEVCKSAWRSFLNSDHYQPETPIIFDSRAVTNRMTGLGNARELIQEIYNNMTPLKYPLLFAFVDKGMASEAYFKTLEVVAGNPHRLLEVDVFKLNLRFFQEMSAAIAWIEDELEKRS